MIEANVRNITPEMAFELLTKNTKNYRRVDPRTVKYYAREMAEGRWQMNGEPIQFAEDGTLLNGQHRLTAIVESGITVPMLVVTLVRHSDKYDNMHYFMLAFGDFKCGVRRRKTYAVQSIVGNVAEALWHKIRKEDGLE